MTLEKKRKIANFILFNIGWWACVLPASYGYYWVGVVFVACNALLHLRWTDSPRRLLSLYAAAGATGFLLESLQGWMGVMQFEGSLSASWLCPPWIVALWVNLSTTFAHSLRWLKGRPLLAAACAALSAAPTYYGAARLDVLTLGTPTWYWIASITLVYTVAFPALLESSLER